MIIDMYRNSSDPKKVYKNLTLLRGNVDLKIWGDVSIENPMFEVELTSIVPDINYVYIPSWGRYYNASLTIVDGYKGILSCEVDTLKSFFDSCRNSPCIARRSTSNPDIRIEDDRVLKLKKPTIIYRKMGAAFTPSTSNNYILTLAGKHIGTP